MENLEVRLRLQGGKLIVELLGTTKCLEAFGGSLKLS
jgi:hypothetical protein